MHDAIQIKGQPVERRATIKRAGAEAMQIKGTQRGEKGENKESGC